MPRLPNRLSAGLRLIIGVATGLVAAAASASAQSFDCREARHRDEMLICREPDLAHLDQQLATLYREQFGKVPRERQDEFQRHESLFLHARRKCSEDYRCIEQSYRNRIKELEDFLSEAQREETTSTTPSADANSERPVEPREPRSTRSERPPEPSGSSNPAASQAQSRPESDMTGIGVNPAGAAEPQWIEAPRKATGTSEHRSKPTRTTAAATPAPPTNDAPAKPTIQWVDPPPAR